MSRCGREREKEVSEWMGDASMCEFEAKRGRRERESQRTSSMAGMLVTPSFFKVEESFLSSPAVALCTAFFFRRMPPARAPADPPANRLAIIRCRASAISFSASMV